MSLLNFAMGSLTGALVVGSSVSRTLSIDKGDMNGSLVSSLLNSLSYGASIYFIASNDWVSYGGSALGSTAICLIMAYRNKKQNVTGGRRGKKARRGIRFSKKLKGGAKG